MGWWRRLTDRLGRGSPELPEPDEQFVAAVRASFDPVVEPAGFTFEHGSGGLSTGAQPLVAEGTESPRPGLRPHTAVLYHGVPEEFARTFPGLVGSSDDLCVDLWIELDMDSDLVEVQLEQFRRRGVARDELADAARELAQALSMARRPDA